MAKLYKSHNQHVWGFFNINLIEGNIQMKDDRTVKIRVSEDIEYNGKEGEREL